MRQASDLDTREPGGAGNGFLVAKHSPRALALRAARDTCIGPVSTPTHKSAAEVTGQRANR